MSREIELKFDVAPGAADILQRSGLLAHSAPERRDQAAVYYDTEAGDLRRAGFSLRIRRSGDRHIQTAKHKADSAAGMFERSEWESPVPGFDLDFDALAETPLAAVMTKKRRKKLKPVVRTDVHRTTWQMVRGQTQVELTLDEGEIEAGEARVPVHELELELRRGPASVLFTLAEEIAETLPLRLGVLSKAERGFALGQGRLGRAAKAEPIRLRPEMTVAEAAAAVGHACLRQFRLNEAALAERPDPEALHQLRVSMRRLRSALVLFRSVAGDTKFEALREEIRWFAGELDEARDLDVLADRLAADKSDAHAVPAALSEARDDAYARVEDALGSERLRRLMLALVRWLEIGAWRSQDKAKKPVPPFAAQALGKRWRKIRSEGAMLRELDDERLHALRINIKKMRYSAEYFSGLYLDGEADRQAAFIAGLERLQDQLGALNDGVTGRDLVARLDLPEPDARRAVKLLDTERDGRETLIASADQAYARLLRSAEYWL